MRTWPHAVTGQMTASLQPAKGQEAVLTHPLPTLKLPRRVGLHWPLHDMSCMAMLRVCRGASSNPPQLVNTSPAATSTFSSHLATATLTHNSLLSSSLVTAIQVSCLISRLLVSKGRASLYYVNTASTCLPQTICVAQVQLLLIEQTGMLLSASLSFTTCRHRDTTQQVLTSHRPSSSNSRCQLWVKLVFQGWAQEVQGKLCSQGPSKRVLLVFSCLQCTLISLLCSSHPQQQLLPQLLLALCLQTANCRCCAIR